MSKMSDSYFRWLELQQDGRDTPEQRERFMAYLKSKNKQPKSNHGRRG